MMPIVKSQIPKDKNSNKLCMKEIGRLWKEKTKQEKENYGKK